MNAVLENREKIYDHIQNWSTCNWTNVASHDEYIIYCVSKDTIQDTAETLIVHRQQGFSGDLYAQYFEYYGILQAVYLQQDAIWALHRLFIGNEPDLSTRPSWSRIRDLRNDTAGHPVGRRRFLNRNAIGYGRVNYSWWPEGDRLPRSEDIALGALLDSYAGEAAAILEDVYAELERTCVTKHT
jgi:hypothetical protein